MTVRDENTQPDGNESAARGDESGSQQVESPVNLDVPVTNPNLVDVIETLAKSPTPEVIDKLRYELNQANYLAILIADDSSIETTETEGQVKFVEDSHIGLLSVVDANENSFFALFTDWNAINSFYEKRAKALVPPAADAWNMVLHDDGHGVVINPGNHPVQLTKEHVEDLLANANS